MSQKEKQEDLPTLDLRQLAHFLAVADHGAISAAADAMGLAQPSLSASIRRLEHLLGAQLAVRDAQGVRLTEAGLALAAHARDLIARGRVAVEDVRRISGVKHGLVTVGMGPSLTGVLGGALAETALHELPDLRLRISELMSVDALAWLDQDRLDLACVYELPFDGALRAEPLFSEEMFLVVAPDTWRGAIGQGGRALDPIAAHELAEFPLVTSSPRHSLRRVVDQFARANGIRLNITMEMDSLAQMVAMVARASGAAILTSSAVQHALAAGDVALVRISDPPLKRRAYLVRKRDRTVTEASLAVESMLKAIVKDLIAKGRIEAELLLRD